MPSSPAVGYAGKKCALTNPEQTEETEMVAKGVGTRSRVVAIDGTLAPGIELSRAGHFWIRKEIFVQRMEGLQLTLEMFKVCSFLQQRTQWQRG